MALDVYDPCPCGSGKKLKFCCHAIVGEMEKVLKLRENNQPHMALQLADGLKGQFAGNAWLETTRAAILMQLGQGVEAKQLLKQLLDDQPDHQLATGLFAMASFAHDGWAGSKHAVHRAFQRCARAFPDLVSELALGVAAVMSHHGHSMAARQHLVLAIKLAPYEAKQSIFVQLLDFDNSGMIPYPLRSVHELATCSGSAGDDKDVRNALRLADIGCFGPAARIFSKQAEQESIENGQAASLWKNAGLCHAWNGDETAAAKALHRAAGLLDDFETAVEHETIAQLLDLDTDSESTNIIKKAYRVKSVARLLTLFDAQPQFIRVEVKQQKTQDDDEVEYPTGLFEVIDRPPLDAAAVTEELTPENVPQIACRLDVFSEDASENQPAEAFLTGLEGPRFDQAVALFEQEAGDEVSPSDAPEDDDPVLRKVPIEHLPVQIKWYFGPQMPAATQLRLKKQHWDAFLDKTWPETSVTGLGGKTPVESIDNDELRVPLAASLYVLDALCSCNRVEFYPGTQRARFKLEPVKTIEVNEEASLNTFSVLQMHRVPIESLTDAQLLQIMNRALLIRHMDFLYRVMLEVESRPSCMEDVEYDRIYMTLCDMEQERGHVDKAIGWLSKGHDLAQREDEAFQKCLRWKLREMSLRLEDPTDPELKPLLMRLWDYYGSRLPQLRQRLEELVAAADIQPPWDSSHGIVTADAAADAEEHVWSPISTPPGTEKKLWLPGQD